MSDVPVPEEFVGNKGPFRLAYQLLWLNRRDIRQNGIIGSFAQFRIKIGLKSDDLGPNIYMSRIIPSSIVFIVVIGSFILISAQYSDWAESHHWSWPNPVKWGWFFVMESSLRTSLTFVIPCLLGLYMYPARRRASLRARRPEQQETALASFLVIASIQWLIAFGLHEVFVLLEVSFQNSLGKSASFFETYRQAWSFSYSIIPAVILLITIFIQIYKIPDLIIAMLATVLTGILFAECDSLSEYWGAPDKNYYLFQFLFGVTVCATLFFVVLSMQGPLKAFRPTAPLNVSD